MSNTATTAKASTKGTKATKKSLRHTTQAANNDDYAAFLGTKRRAVDAAGLDVLPPINDALFPFQRDIAAWALRMGRCAIFAECGLGKTLMQLEWAAHVPPDVLLLTPLAVSHQTEKEAARFGYDAAVSGDGTKRGKITITNYQKLEKFDLSQFGAVVLDESSILKAFDGKTRTTLIESFAATPYRLCCTATPAPNDHMELGNHSEFLGVMSRAEMLATFFVHDGGDTSQWRLKGHAVADFWRWVAGWAAMIRKPSDLGYPDDGFALPPLHIHEHLIETGQRESGLLFVDAAKGLEAQRKARRATLAARVEKAAELAAGDDPCMVWCELNDEGDALARSIDGAVQVAGADSDDDKASKLDAFTDGAARVMVSKPKIAGFGMNWQHCASTVFVGVSNSYEQFYQAVRRFWRFGQTKPVHVHCVTTDLEVGVLENIKAKQAAADAMAEEMVKHMKETMKQNIYGQPRQEDKYERDADEGKGWTLYRGDSCEVVREMPDNSVHYSIFSPPFASLYTYSNSPRDMGNCRDHAEFYGHFKFLVDELLRVTMPGRLLSFHCMNLPTSKERDGVIGITDFRGILIKLFTDAGWIYHSEVCIWKDPVTAMQRTKALGLLHKQIKKDSCMSRQGIADYLVTMRKPGDNPERVTHTNETFPVEVWQRYASPVWTDINPSDTLQYRSARESEDERHICPLQLQVIRRAVHLWTNPGDVVLSPFAGIGSEGYVAIEEGRKFVGIELKASYFGQARKNLMAAEIKPMRMFV